MLENIRLALSSIMVNKLRTFLTMLGIIIGIAAVIAISAIGNGGKYQIQKSLEQFGTNRLMVYLNWSNNSGITMRDYITDRDIEVLKELEGVEAIAPLFEEWTSMRANNKKIDVVLIGANEDSKAITNVELVKGRFINQQDINNRSYVVVISEKDARELYGDINVIGEAITLNTYRGQVEFTIVGISKYEENLFSSQTNNGRAQLYVPISTIMRVYNQNVYYGVNLKVESREAMDTIGQQVTKLLSRLHSNQDKYTVLNLEQTLETVNGVINNITAVLALIAGIALLVGGIGIMNIMLVTVTERTREIGIKKAIGARTSIILMQFLTESVIISVIGGLVGIALGYGIGNAVSSLLDMPPLISVSEVLMGTTVAVSVGIIFGVYPAKKAAKLDPIEALRYE